MECHTDPIFLPVTVESIFENQQGALLYRYFQQSFELDYPAANFLPPCRMRNY